MLELEAAWGKLESGARKTQPHTPAGQRFGVHCHGGQDGQGMSVAPLSEQGAFAFRGNRAGPKQSWLLPPPPLRACQWAFKLAPPPLLLVAQATRTWTGTRTGGPGPCECCFDTALRVGGS